MPSAPGKVLVFTTENLARNTLHLYSWPGARVSAGMTTEVDLPLSESGWRGPLDSKTGPLSSSIWTCTKSFVVAPVKASHVSVKSAKASMLCAASQFAMCGVAG